jgi:hypothetical protein
MVDVESPMIICKSALEVVGTMNALMPKLPPDVRKQLNMIKLSYLQRYGVDGLHSRVNDRTVAAILTEFQEADLLRQVKSDDFDGIHVDLFDSGPDGELGGNDTQERAAEAD